MILFSSQVCKAVTVGHSLIIEYTFIVCYGLRLLNKTNSNCHLILTLSVSDGDNLRNLLSQACHSDGGLLPSQIINTAVPKGCVLGQKTPSLRTEGTDTNHLMSGCGCVSQREEKSTSCRMDKGDFPNEALHASHHNYDQKPTLKMPINTTGSQWAHSHMHTRTPTASQG